MVSPRNAPAQHGGHRDVVVAASSNARRCQVTVNAAVQLDGAPCFGGTGKTRSRVVGDVVRAGATTVGGHMEIWSRRRVHPGVNREAESTGNRTGVISEK